MSRLEELIAELCPNGVEFVPLSSVCNIEKGVQYNKVNMKESGSFPVVNGGINPSGYIETYNQDGNVITISQGGASAGYVNWQKNRFWAGAHCYVLKSKNEINNKFLYYFVKSSERVLQESQYGAGIPALAKSVVASLPIPVPPLPVQEEIVRILDKFTALSQELSQELVLRKKQYEYYLEKVIDEYSNLTKVEYKKLKDISRGIFRGSGIKRDEITPDGIPCVRYGEIYTTYNVWFSKCVSHTALDSVKSPKYFENGDILFAITGEKVEDIAKSIAYVGNEKCLAGGDIIVLKHNQNPKYLAYALSTYDARKQKSAGKSKNKVVHSNASSIEEITIPVPPLSVQEEIVSILDKFFELTSDLTSGIPAEIAARQKQYEYYRDQLLTFPPLNPCESK